MVSDRCPVFSTTFTQSVASFQSCFPVGYGKINIKETFSIIKKWTFRKRKRIFRR